MSKRKSCFEGTVLVTSYGKEGETGMIHDINRHTCPTDFHLAQVIAQGIVEEMQRVWPAELAVNELRKSPRTIIVSVEIERKAVKLYGQ